jgi:hypothetical protein
MLPNNKCRPLSLAHFQWPNRTRTPILIIPFCFLPISETILSPITVDKTLSAWLLSVVCHSSAEPKVVRVRTLANLGRNFETVENVSSFSSIPSSPASQNTYTIRSACGDSTLTLFPPLNTVLVNNGYSSKLFLQLGLKLSISLLSLRKVCG